MKILTFVFVFSLFYFVYRTNGASLNCSDPNIINALNKFYTQLNGDYWINNTNWKSGLIYSFFFVLKILLNDF